MITIGPSFCHVTASLATAISAVPVAIVTPDTWVIKQEAERVPNKRRSGGGMAQVAYVFGEVAAVWHSLRDT